MNALCRPTHTRSFVRRDSRITLAQSRAYENLWPQFGLLMGDGLLHFPQLFGRSAPCFLEIGFGSGSSLIALAKQFKEYDFIGVETHKPGIGALLIGIDSNQLTNLRVFHGDIIEIIKKKLPKEALDGVQIFFPDPWPKRKHHERRLIQPEFIRSIVDKMKPKGSLHLATDWEDYAIHMMKVLSQEEALFNQVAPYQYAARSIYRPLNTKFETRALREGRLVWELQFEKK